MVFGCEQMDTQSLYTILKSLEDRTARLESTARDRATQAVVARVDMDKVDGGWAEQSKGYDSGDLAAIKHLRAQKLVDAYISNHGDGLSPTLWPLLRTKLRGLGRGKGYTDFMEDILTIASERFT